MEWRTIRENKSKVLSRFSFVHCFKFKLWFCCHLLLVGSVFENFQRKYFNVNSNCTARNLTFLVWMIRAICFLFCWKTNLFLKAQHPTAEYSGTFSATGGGYCPMDWRNHSWSESGDRAAWISGEEEYSRYWIQGTESFRTQRDVSRKIHSGSALCRAVCGYWILGTG